MWWASAASGTGAGIATASRAAAVPAGKLAVLRTRGRPPAVGCTRARVAARAVRGFVAPGA
ncbi:hypothetical protein [Streptomyces sp. NPDC001843]|uniref:hypothetical protein n=1 Tax=Streptomyces sp. NPDC001843 TaxID=3364617 RepID=UPI003676AFD1